MTELDLNGPADIPFEPWPDRWVTLGIIARFDAVAERHADDLAVDDGRHRLTYRQLAMAARHLAARIDAACEPGAVGILQPHSAAFWVAILACIGAGRTLVALDLHHPASRNAAILNDAGLTAVIVPPGLDGESPAIPPDVLRLPWCLEESPSGPAPDWPHPEAPATDAVALALYTSGSTGRPKGIANNQQALLQRAMQYVNSAHLHAGDRMLTLSSPCTIAGLREGLTTLLVGATLHVVDVPRAGLGEVVRRIPEAGVTTLNAVPSTLRALFNAPDAERTMRSLRHIRVGGEALFWTDIALFRRVLSERCRIQPCYSATEFTGTQWFVPADVQPEGPVVPVGYMLPGSEASVVDDAGRPVPPGELGELVLRGHFIALGGWRGGRCVPGAMEPDPLRPGQRVMRTGDLVRMDAQGLYTVIGRKDRQVKIRGVRVEPHELEAALRGLPDVADAAVLTRSDGAEARLSAFVVPRAGRTSLTEEQIRAALRALLPPAMRPARVHVLGAIPALPSGKPDVAALLALDDGSVVQAPPDEGTEAAGTAAVLQAVRQAWCNVLGRHALNGDRSFEAAGGDSLRLLQFVLQLETLLGRRLHLELFTGNLRIADAARAAMQDTVVPALSGSCDERPAMFLFPGIAGDEPRLAQFRAVLHDRFSFSLIAYPGWQEMVRDGRGFEGVVDLAIAQVTAKQPTGELQLAGYSFGGNVAWAVASRLTEQGRTVRFLGILDSDLDYISGLPAPPERQPSLTGWRQVLGAGASQRLHAGAGFLLSKLVCDVVGLERASRSAWLWRRLLPRPTGFAFDRRICAALRMRALWQWSRLEAPPLRDVPSVLFRSTEHGEGSAFDLGWASRCPDLPVVPVAGGHLTMLDPPHRATLCALFADAVDAVAARPA